MRAEFDFIKNLRNHFNISSVGDDCAVLPKDDDHDLLITVDLLVEEIDFRLEWAPAEFIGHKALAVSLSDIAAMGGRPVSSLLSIGVPKAIWNTHFVDKFYEGYMTLSEEFGVELVGGDVSKTPEHFVIDSIVLGEVSKGQAVLRSTAKPGDLIYVTGALGGAAAGLELLESGEKLEESENDDPLLRQLKPTPRVNPGLLLAESQLATSMIDISDGLSGDLGHICEESGVGAKIYAEKIPVDKYLQGFDLSDERKLELALHGGEDFELLFTVHPKNMSDESLAGCHQIGEVTEDVGTITLIRDGKSKVLSQKGFEHF